MTTLQQAMETALAHHRHGQLQQAELIYRQILAVDPQQGDAWHMLGVIAGQQENHDSACQLIAQARALLPGVSEVPFNLAKSLRALKRFEEAVACYQDCLLIQPDDFDAYLHLGHVLSDIRQFEEAASAYRRAVTLQPLDPQVHFALGVAYQRLHDQSRAAESFSRFVELQVPAGHVASPAELAALLAEKEAACRAPSRNDDNGVSYLELMKRCLTNTIYEDPNILPGDDAAYDLGRRLVGGDWPARAHTMIGRKRLDNIQFCVEDALARGTVGDLLEAGVWRGGAVIFMRAILRAHGITDRRVWAADSFAGLPPPNAEEYPHDAGLMFCESAELSVSLEQVQENFRRYDLLDERVTFLQGWFRDTLPAAAVGQLAVLRLDGDLYESTMDALTHLYPKLVRGGYLIVDDFNCIPATRQAVLDYRAEHGISDKIRVVDWSAIYWQRT